MVRSSAPQNVPSLEVKTTGITRVSSLDDCPSKEDPNKDITAPSLNKNPTKFITTFPHAAKGGTKASSLEKIAAQLQANQLKSLEIKSEAVCSIGSPTTGSSSNPSLPCTLTPSSGSPAVITQTLSKVTLNNKVAKGTGTGSITATPSSFMTAVTTTASTTSVSLVGQDLLGKRVRKQSTKYEDFEQPMAMVSVV